MEIRVVDFDVLTKNYTNYQNGLKNMEDIRKSFVSRMDPIFTTDLSGVCVFAMILSSEISNSKLFSITENFFM